MSCLHLLAASADEGQQGHNLAEVRHDAHPLAIQGHDVGGLIDSRTGLGVNLGHLIAPSGVSPLGCCSSRGAFLFGGLRPVAEFHHLQDG